MRPDIEAWESWHPRVVAVLTAEQRAWLDDALDLVHPGHPWRS